MNSSQAQSFLNSDFCTRKGGRSMFSEIKSAIVVVLVIVALIGFAHQGYSQTETGQITGSVLDPTGAVIPNAKVTVKSVSTGLERQTATTTAGTYTVTNLQPGRYTVTAEAPGFSSIQQMADVTVGARVGLDIRMT